MLFTYISSCRVWLYMQWLVHVQMKDICSGIKKTSKHKKWYDSQKVWYEEAANSIWHTYLWFGGVLRVVNNPWLISYTLT